MAKPAPREEAPLVTGDAARATGHRSRPPMQLQIGDRMTDSFAKR